MSCPPPELICPRERPVGGRPRRPHHLRPGTPPGRVEKVGEAALPPRRRRLKRVRAAHRLQRRAHRRRRRTGLRFADLTFTLQFFYVTMKIICTVNVGIFNKMLFNSAKKFVSEKKLRSASLTGCRRGLEVVGDRLVEVHGNLQEEIPHAQVAAEQARRLEPGRDIQPVFKFVCLSEI